MTKQVDNYILFSIISNMSSIISMENVKLSDNISNIKMKDAISMGDVPNISLEIAKRIHSKDKNIVLIDFINTFYVENSVWFFLINKCLELREESIDLYIININGFVRSEYALLELQNSIPLIEDISEIL